MKRHTALAARAVRGATALELMIKKYAGVETHLSHKSLCTVAALQLLAKKNSAVSQWIRLHLLRRRSSDHIKISTSTSCAAPSRSGCLRSSSELHPVTARSSSSLPVASARICSNVKQAAQGKGGPGCHSAWEPGVPGGHPGHEQHGGTDGSAGGSSGGNGAPCGCRGVPR